MQSEYHTHTVGSKYQGGTDLQQHLYKQTQDKSEFCDVTIVMGDMELSAHWSVLLRCPYFQSMYNCGLKEKETSVVQLQHGAPVAMKTAIEYLYLGSAEVSFESALEILDCADFLQIDSLKKHCVVYLSNFDITAENCVQLWITGKTYAAEFHKEALQFVRGNLPEVLEKNAALGLTTDMVRGLIADPTLNYVPREIFFEFIVRWVEDDKENRESSFGDLFCEMDFEAVSRSFLEKIEQHPLVKENEVCEIHVSNVIMRYALGEVTGMKEVILLVGRNTNSDYRNLIGSREGEGGNRVYAYIPSESRWTLFTFLPEIMEKSKFAYRGKNLFAIDADDKLSSLYIFDMEKDEWSCSELTYTGGSDLKPDKIVGMHCSHDKLIIVALSRPFFKGSSDKLQKNVKYNVYDIAGLQVSTLKTIGEGLEPTKVKSSVVGSYICVLVGEDKQSEKARLLMYNVDTGTIESREGYFDEILFTHKGLIKTVRLANEGYTGEAWKLTDSNAVNIPRPVTMSITECHTSCGDLLYIFGGNLKECERATSVCRFDFLSGKWSDVGDIPEMLVSCDTTVAEVPSQRLKCHIDCPHCARKIKAENDFSDSEVYYQSDSEESYFYGDSD